MPKISEFYGIRIYINIRGEHPPPHFHAVYGEHEALISIEPLGLFAGKLPPKAFAMVLEWAAAHQSELLAGWNAAQNGELPSSICPLD